MYYIFIFFGKKFFFSWIIVLQYLVHKLFTYFVRVLPKYLILCGAFSAEQSLISMLWFLEFKTFQFFVAAVQEYSWFLIIGLVACVSAKFTYWFQENFLQILLNFISRNLHYLKLSFRFFIFNPYAFYLFLSSCWPTRTFCMVLKKIGKK